MPLLDEYIILNEVGMDLDLSHNDMLHTMVKEIELCVQAVKSLALESSKARRPTQRPAALAQISAQV